MDKNTLDLLNGLLGTNKLGFGNLGDFGLRVDNTPKGKGYFGVLKRPDGRISTELSMGFNFDGNNVEIPLLVPTLSQDEIQHLLNNGKPTKSIIDKAIYHARLRLSQSKSPFAQEGEQIPPPIFSSLTDLFNNQGR